MWSPKGKPLSEHAKDIDFFVKRDGRWQSVTGQMTTITPWRRMSPAAGPPAPWT